MKLFRFGFHISSISYSETTPAQLFQRVVDVAVAAEQAGFDSVWVPDHVHQNDLGGGPTGPMLEAYTLLGALAQHTDSVWLGSLVSPVTFRHPGVLAKAITTLDVVSGGRAVLGIGAGWDTDEHAAYGIPFPRVQERWERLEESVEICRDLLRGGPVDFRGRHYALEAAWDAPRPVQERVPLLIGGSGERLTLPLVAKYADACNLFGEPGVIAHKLGVLRQHCDLVGRDVGEITTTCGFFAPESADEVCRLTAERLDVGIDGVVIFASGCPSTEAIGAWGDALQRAFG